MDITCVNYIAIQSNDAAETCVIQPYLGLENPSVYCESDWASNNPQCNAASASQNSIILVNF
jgi:hypothetical protein